MILFEDVMAKFQIDDEVVSVTPLGHGSVNHTYEVECKKDRYVLQEINHYVFKYPTEVMNNIFLVTEYLRNVIEKEDGDSAVETLTFIKTDSDNMILQTETGSYFRVYRMIVDAYEMEKPTDYDSAYFAGKVVGQFQRRLNHFDVSILSKTHPKMHDMKYHIRSLFDAVRADICFRTADCQEQIQFVLDRSDKLNRIREALSENRIPVRVTHNDTGYQNVLVNKENKAVCLIDLDTIMPGASVYDFGEAVRAGAATFPESEKFGDIEIDLELYRAYLEGYLNEMCSMLNHEEKQLLAYSVWQAAMDRGIHYLLDYLRGDYDRNAFSDERENLYRAVNQFLLVLDIEEKMPEMERMADVICKNCY